MIALGARCPTSRVGAAVLLAALAAPSVTFAVTFNLIGDANTKVLNFYGASSTGCLISNNGTVFSQNGMLTHNNGVLSWSGVGSLEVVDRITLANTGGVSTPCYDSWVSLNAEDFPLEFLITEGDPAQFLKITPRLFGTVTYNTGVGGWPSTSSLTLEMRMTVSVNGQPVSTDRYFLVKDQTTGQTSSWTPEFPKGGLNTVMIPNGAANGNVVTVDLFAYRRYSGDGTLYCVANSSYGNQLGIMVTAEALGPVGVGDDVPETLALGVRPNPSSAGPRISYRLPRPSQVELTVFDLRGARVARLVDGVQEAGHHEVAMPRSSSDRGRLVSGIYLVELRAGDEHRTSKFVLTD